MEKQNDTTSSSQMPWERESQTLSAGPNRSSQQTSDSSESAQKKAIPLASVTLPKAGGAISSMGEKVSTDSATGTAQFVVPIATSQVDSRNGMVPNLNLTYGSTAGNGPFGYGWGLSIGEITRKTRNGLPQYLDDIASTPVQDRDTFILSGVEDLVPESTITADGTWSLSAPQPRTMNGVDYHVSQYRPRIESVQQRIEKWTTTDNINSHWRTISANNVTSIYGNSSNSQIVDPADNTRVFSWLLSEVRDDLGGRYVVEYKAEDSVGVDETQSNESNRTSITRSANRYPKRIYYGNLTSTLAPIKIAETNETEWLFQVVFDYGDHYTSVPTPKAQKDWTVRRDPFSTYRAGFEIRTYRLCQRVLMFHNFPNEPGVGADCLVKSTDFVYRNAQGTPDPSNLGHELGTFLSAVSVVSYRRGDTNYTSASLPPLEFSYSFTTIDGTIRDLNPESLKNLPFGIDGSNYNFVDLDGEGAAGILTETLDGGAWMYKSPLGEGKFGSLERLPYKSNLAQIASHPKLMDLEKDGSFDVVLLGDGDVGYSRRTWEDGHPVWQSFRKFFSIPQIDWSYENVIFLDLTGDGIPDILVTEDTIFTWYMCLGPEGFGPARRLLSTKDEEGPRLIFADVTHCIFLADMSGDGLVDLVRIRHGEVTYWPNKGYGQFGSKVCMDHAPWLDHHDQWDSSRIRLADVDGNGATDIIYLGQEGVSIYMNLSGNAWDLPIKLPSFLEQTHESSVRVADLFGKGTPCLIWSSYLSPGGRTIRYVDLTGGTKPNLLVSMVNNLGSETNIQYAPSTKFYFKDKAAGTPWVSRIPFPIYVVEKVETFDHIGRTYHSCHYTYHHGYYDGYDREFRGFGRVEQIDTEHLDVLGDSQPAVNLDPESNVPPILTKTWFHTGLWGGDGKISRYFEKEYWREPGLSDLQYSQMQLSDTALPSLVMLPDGSTIAHSLDPSESKEASRSLRGSMLRQEIYGLDLPDKQNLPYSVTERNFDITLLQPRNVINQYSIFRVGLRESVSFQYDRYTVQSTTGATLCSPRVTHNMVLEMDRFGSVTQSCAIAYGQRKAEPDPQNLFTLKDHQRQMAASFSYDEHDYTNEVTTLDTFQLPLLSEQRSYELRGIDQDRSDPMVTSLFTVDFIISQIASAADGSHDLPFEDFDGVGATAGHPYRRLIAQNRTIYQKDDLSAPLSLGTIESRALVFQTLQKAFTSQTLQDTFLSTGKVSGVTELETIMADECKYVHSEGDDAWWIPSGRVFYSPNPTDTPAQELQYAVAAFFLPHRYRDPHYSSTFNTESSVRYDQYNLLALEDIGALGNRVTAGQRDPVVTKLLVKNGLDYRLLTPVMSMDPNENITLMAYDILGLVTGVAAQGKPGQGVGDSLDGFVSDLSDAQVAAYFSDPVGQASAMLGNATSRFVHDVWAYYRSKMQAQPSPAVAATIVRETHVSDLKAGESSSIVQAVSYSDGFGRVVQSKKYVDPGPAPQRDPTTGQIIIGTDGQPVMTTTAVDARWLASGWTVFNNKGLAVRTFEPFYTDLFQFEFAVKTGVSPILFYDPLGRTVGVLNPDHSFSKVTFDPWHSETWDFNDTILVSDPTTDPDLGGYFKRLSNTEYLPTWYTARKGGTLGPEEQKCAQNTAIHANTPTSSYFDTLGRTFLTVAQNAFKYSDAAPSDPPTVELFASRVDNDIQSYIRRVFDPKTRLVTTNNYGMLKQPIYNSSMETGQRWSLMDIDGNVRYRWDDRGYRFHAALDELQRPLATFQQRNNDTEIMIERAEYGESETSPESQNARVKLVRIYDQVGVLSHDTFDFKGNSLNAKRTLTQLYSEMIDWNKPVPLELKTYSTSTTYDAISRPKTMTLPDTTVVFSGYNREGQITSVKANLRGDSQTTTFVSSIEYTAKGQRSFINYGNEVTGAMGYDRLTNRLTNKVTRRDPKSFPDDCPQPPNPNWPGCQLQKLSYTYDPMGNTTDIRDDAQQTIFFRNKRVDPSNSYLYDAVYRLIEATGREHLGQAGPIPSSPYDTGLTGLAHPGDGQAMGTYLERYSYDNAGNILSLRHIGSSPTSPGWTRSYNYNEASQLEPTNFSNRLSSTQVGSTTESYAYDLDSGLHGNITSFPHLSLIAWNSKDQLQMSSSQKVNSGTPEKTFYVYNGGGQRLRTVTERQADANTTPTRKSQTLYLGGFEVYTEYGTDGNTVTLERESIHIADTASKVAIVQTRTQGTESSNVPAQLIRYQIPNHLNSVSVELDDTGRIISYEEYTPFGSTSYQGVQNRQPPAKKYRFSGKEKDRQTGFYYHGARYYLPWLGRWASADPAGLVDGLNVFSYVSNSPINLIDPSGTDGQSATEIFVPMKSFTPDDTEETMKKKLFDAGWEYSGKAERLGPINWRADIHPRGQGDGKGSETSSSDSPSPKDGGDQGADAQKDSGSDPGTPEEKIYDPARIAGLFAQSTYNILQRVAYESKIAANSQQVLDTLEVLTKMGRAGWHGAAVMATEVSEAASGERIKIRLATRKMMTQSARGLSELIDDSKPPKFYQEKYASPPEIRKMIGKVIEKGKGVVQADPQTVEVFQWTKDIATAAGSSRKSVKAISGLGKFGIAATALTASIAIYDVWSAPPEERTRVGIHEAGNFVGGIIGAEAGAALGLFAMGILIGLGAVSGPVGWLAMGLWFVGSILGAWVVGKLGANIADNLYNLF